MKKQKIMIGIFVLIILPFAYADVVIPGQKSIPVNNVISNINEFPDYAFFSTFNKDSGPGPGLSMCPVKIINANGKVSSDYYNLCTLSIYAVEKDDFNEDELVAMNDAQIEDYLASEKVIEVLSNVEFKDSVPDSNPQKEKNVSLTIPPGILKKAGEKCIIDSDCPVVSCAEGWICESKCVNGKCKSQSTKNCEDGLIAENGTCHKLLSNGRKAEIKIMPETASQRAIERLGQLNFTVQLKETGEGDNIKPVYELKAEKEVKILGLFKKKAEITAEIDAETGEATKIKKPWWAFLASGI